MTWRAAIPAVFLAVACNDAPDALAPRGAADAAFSNVPAAGQVDGIQALTAAQDAAWAAKDASAYADTYTEDVEVINPVGGILSGREAVRAQHAFLFNPVSGFFRATTSTWTLRDLSFLTGTTALVKHDVVLTGISQLPPGLTPFAPGEVRTRVTWIAVKEGSQWRIRFQQMTPIPPPPGP